MFNFEPNDYRNYTNLLEQIDNVDNIKNEIDSLNLSFVSEEGEDIDTKKEVKEKDHIVKDLSDNLSSLVYATKELIINEYQDKLDLYINLLKSNIGIGLLDECSFPFSSWVVINSVLPRSQELDFFSDMKYLIKTFKNINDKDMEISNIYSLYNGIVSDSYHIINYGERQSNIQKNLYQLITEIQKEYNLEKIPFDLLQNNEYKTWYNLLTNQNYEIKKINNSETNMVLMSVIKNNASDLNQVKDLLPQYVFEENNVQSLINTIFSINNNYFMKANKAFNDNLIINFSKLLCNDKLNQILESKLEKIAVTEENKIFIKEFAIINRYNEMQNTLDKNKDNTKKNSLKI